MTAMLRSLAALALVLLLISCQSGGLVVGHVATSVQRPSQVAVYLSVRSANAPITDLTPASFSIWENGQRLDATAVNLSLLERAIAAEHYTVVLLDASNLVPGPKDDVITRATEAFVRKVAGSQSVSVYAFDGGETLRTIVEAYGPTQASGVTQNTKAQGGAPTNAADAQPPTSTKPEATGKDALKLAPVAIEGSDPSRDLHGAVMRGTDKLEQALSRAVKPVRVGTLVVFTRGPDLAGRVSAEQVDERLTQARASVILISVGADEGSRSRVRYIGRDGVVRAATIQKVEQAFEQAADRVLALERSHYLLAYCSPARAGDRELRIDVQVFGGREPLTGSLETTFDARGFTSGCDAKATPHFVVTLVPGDRDTIPAAVPQGVEAAPAATSGTSKVEASPAKPAAPAPQRKWRPRPAAPKKPVAAPAPPSKPSGPPPSDFEP